MHLQRIARLDFRKQAEVAISRQQFLGTVRYTDCRNPGVVDDRTTYSRPENESLDNRQEVVGFAKQ